jgi:hypothetical protein
MFEYPVQAISDPTLDTFYCSPVMAKTDQGLRRGGGGINRGETFLSVKAKSDPRSSDTLPVKASGDLKLGNQLSDISGSYLPIVVIKKGLGSQDMQDWLCKNPQVTFRKLVIFGC